MVRTNQGGSVLGFVIIGGVLALLLVGGIYVAKQQATPESPAATPAPAPSEEKPAPQPQPNDQSGDEKQPAPAPEEGAQPDTSDNQPTDNQPAQPQEDEPESSQNLPGTGGPKELPRTGPAGALASLVAVVLLTGATTAYLRSRRAAASL